MNKTLVIVLVVVVVLVGGYFLFANKGAAPTEEVNTRGDSNANTSPLVGEETPTQPQVKEFTVEGENYSFSVKEMRVKEGDTVKVTFKNVEGMHDWMLDEFPNTKTKELQKGESETLEFVVDKTGTFEYYCSIGQHRANGMVGKLIVE